MTVFDVLHGRNDQICFFYWSIFSDDEVMEEGDDVFEPDLPNGSLKEERLSAHHFTMIRMLGQGASGTCHL